jgi:hypothetical protein
MVARLGVAFGATKGGILVLALTMVALFNLPGCDNESALAQRVEADVQAASEAQASDFRIGDSSYGEDTSIRLEPPAAGSGISANDLVATLLVVDGYRRDNRALRRSTVLYISNSESDITAMWSGGSFLWGASAKLVRVQGATMAYTDAFCGLPDLEGLESPGAGSDFSRIADCNPKLTSLGILAWEESTGLDGLGGLGRLETLFVRGTVGDIEQVPKLASLKDLTLSLEEDTTANREALQSRLPGCSITYTDAAGQIAMYPSDSNHARELVERSIPRLVG